MRPLHSCYKCQSPNHTISNCDGPVRCSCVLGSTNPPALPPVKQQIRNALTAVGPMCPLVLNAVSFVNSCLRRKMIESGDLSLCSFNINGTKDNDHTIDQKMSDYDILFLQEYFLPAVSVNSLRRSSAHYVFTANAGRTRVRLFWSSSHR